MRSPVHPQDVADVGTVLNGREDEDVGLGVGAQVRVVRLLEEIAPGCGSLDGQVSE
jgi:hypothetical protein